jgi:hypothetical protein
MNYVKIPPKFPYVLVESCGEANHGNWPYYANKPAFKWLKTYF